MLARQIAVEPSIPAPAMPRQVPSAARFLLMVKSLPLRELIGISVIIFGRFPAGHFAHTNYPCGSTRRMQNTGRLCAHSLSAGRVACRYVANELGPFPPDSGG